MRAEVGAAWAVLRSLLTEVRVEKSHGRLRLSQEGETESQARIAPFGPSYGRRPSAVAGRAGPRLRRPCASGPPGLMGSFLRDPLGAL